MNYLQLKNQAIIVPLVIEAIHTVGNVYQNQRSENSKLVELENRVVNLEQQMNQQSNKKILGIF